LRDLCRLLLGRLGSGISTAPAASSTTVSALASPASTISVSLRRRLNASEGAQGEQHKEENGRLNGQHSASPLT